MNQITIDAAALESAEAFLEQFANFMNETQLSEMTREQTLFIFAAYEVVKMYHFNLEIEQGANASAREVPSIVGVGMVTPPGVLGVFMGRAGLPYASHMARMLNICIDEFEKYPSRNTAYDLGWNLLTLRSFLRNAADDQQWLAHWEEGEFEKALSALERASEIYSDLDDEHRPDIIITPEDVAFTTEELIEELKSTREVFVSILRSVRLA